MKTGDKYIIEIAEVEKYKDDNGNDFDLGRVKGFKALTLDEAALKKLEKVVYCKNCKHAFLNTNQPDNPLICGLTKMCGTTDPDWFCADGEEK